MTPIQLINKVKFEDVLKALKYYYPDPKIGKIGIQLYKKVFETIKKYKDKPESNWILRVYFVRDSFDGEEYYSVGAYNIHKKEQKCAIEFIPWETTANYTLEENTLNSYKYAEIVAHYLWEITFISFNPKKIQKEYDAIVKEVDEFD